MKSFEYIVSFVIDNLEGGYYHPNMLLDGRVTDQRYKYSGETFLGIDRLAGGSLNYTASGIKFWSIIDNANAKDTWSWNYKGGVLYNQLRTLAGEIIKPEYERLSKKYLSEKSIKLINGDDRLRFNFIYSTWNGSGWFKYFAEKLNDYVINNTDIESLVNFVVDLRINSTNSLIKQGGNKIKLIIGQLQEFKKKI